MTDQAKPKRGVHWIVWTLPALLLIILPTLNHFFVFQLFRQPSGSMQPALHAGQMFAVSKWAYGYNRFSFSPFDELVPDGQWSTRVPERGDIVVFRPAPDPERSFIKRVIGLPGDQIQMIGGVLHINGEAVALEPAEAASIINYDGSTETAPGFRETLPNGVSYTVIDRGTTELDNTSVYTVPAGHVFIMGDDRDNSADSRVPSVVGYVPVDNIIGRVEHVF